MRWIITGICVPLLLCASALAPVSVAQENTIVLKNGRRIAALSVQQDGDKVRYETAAGTLTLPRAIVDHVESGGLPTANGPADGGKLSLKAPEAAASDPALAGSKSEIAGRVIRDGEVDRNYVAGLENEARSGTALANWNAALAHHTA